MCTHTRNVCSQRTHTEIDIHTAKNKDNKQGEKGDEINMVTLTGFLIYMR